MYFQITLVNIIILIERTLYRRKRWTYQQKMFTEGKIKHCLYFASVNARQYLTGEKKKAFLGIIQRNWRHGGYLCIQGLPVAGICWHLSAQHLFDSCSPPLCPRGARSPKFPSPQHGGGHVARAGGGEHRHAVL